MRTFKLTPLCLWLLATLPGCRDDTAPERASGGAKTPSAPRPRAPKRPRYRTVLIQLDGMPAAWLERYLKERRFLPEQPPATAKEVAAGGFARLAAGLRAPALVPVDPSVTAPNMATMLTGAFPAVHGVLANRFYRRGKRVNGFAEPVQAEALWQAATRQGLRVISYVAVGTRCSEPPPTLHRLVCFSYGPYLSRPRARETVALATPAARGALRLRVGPRIQGTPRLELGVSRSAAGKVTLHPPPGVALRGGPAGMDPGDARAVLWPGGKLPDGARASRRLTWLTLRSFDRRSGRAVFHVGGTAVNLAQPPSFRLALDRAGVIRPAPADERGFTKGLVDERLLVRTALREADAVVRFGRHIGAGDRFDLATIYLSTVDVLGHLLLAPAGRAELAAEEVVRFRAALEGALRQVDRRLAALLDALEPKRTRVILASDHGMMAVRHDVSLKAALAAVDPRIRVSASAGAGFVHLPRGVDAQRVIAALRRLEVGRQPVFARGRIADRRAMAALGLPGGAADLFVQPGPGLSLSGRRSRKVAGWPSNLATHGHRADLPAMHGVLLAHGPGIVRQHPGPLHMTQVAALVAAALGVSPPRSARTTAPTIWR